MFLSGLPPRIHGWKKIYYAEAAYRRKCEVDKIRLFWISASHVEGAWQAQHELILRSSEENFQITLITTPGNAIKRSNNAPMSKRPS